MLNIRFTLLRTHKTHTYYTHKPRGAWRKTQHLDRLLTMDATSRQHKTHSRLSLNTLTHVYTQKRRSQNSTVKLTKSGALNTQYLDRLLTTDIRSAACDTLKAFAHCCYACTHIHTSSFNLSRSYTEEAMLSLCTCTQTHTHTHTHCQHYKAHL